MRGTPVAAMVVVLAVALMHVTHTSSLAAAPVAERARHLLPRAAAEVQSAIQAESANNTHPLTKGKVQ